MSFNHRMNRILFQSFFILLTLIICSPTNAQFVDIELTVGDITTYPGETDVLIPIYLKNYRHDIAGFQFWLQNSNPSILEYNLSFESVGTLTEPWNTNTHSLGGYNQDILITSISPIPFTDLIEPQLGVLPLIYIKVDIFDLPDTMSERVVDLIINTDFIDHFSFSDQYGNLIGVDQIEVEDTSFYVCDVWSGSECLSWSQIQGPLSAADSISIETKLVATLNLDKVIVTNGSVTVLANYICGDINGSLKINISDLTYFVNYLFAGGDAPPILAAADCDGDGEMTISDLTCFVCYMFDGCPDPLCGK